jgi:hypothetical protein
MQSIAIMKMEIDHKTSDNMTSISRIFYCTLLPLISAVQIYYHRCSIVFCTVLTRLEVFNLH